MVAPRPPAPGYARLRRCSHCFEALTMPAVAVGDDLLHQHCALAIRVDRIERMIEKLARQLDPSLHQ